MREEPAKPPKPEEFWLWPECVRTWLLFQASQPLWRGTGMQREGLDRPGVEVEMRKARIRPKDRRRVWEEIEVMERAALEEWALRAAKSGG